MFNLHSLHYRVGLPGWKLAARLGLTLSFRVHIHYDPEAASYWTTSPDIGGLIVTGNTVDELLTEVGIAAPDLVAFELGKEAPATLATFCMDGRLQSA